MSEYDLFDDKPKGTGAKKPKSNVGEYSVWELSNKLKSFVEDNFSYVRVRGELGRISTPASGHIYLDLKDDKAVMAGVVWRGNASKLKIKPEQGLEVIVTGKLTTYPGQSKYQIVITDMEPAGVGALMALLEERKKKLAAEGLFDEERKRPLPFLPRVIGIVTSPTGAVIRDMMHGFNERFPAKVLVWPVRVQGESCAGEVANAIAGFNRFGDQEPLLKPDVLIVARGGGSLEDLWGFNEEIVARAAAQSEIPVISAVGHETDWTLIDYVSDARAPTPTKAAEWAVPKYSELIERQSDLANRLRLGLLRFVEKQHAVLSGLKRGLPKGADLLALPRQRFDAATGRLMQSLRMNTNTRRGRYDRVAAHFGPVSLLRLVERQRQLLAPLQMQFSQSVKQGLQGNRHNFSRAADKLRPQLLMHPAGRGRERLDVLQKRRAQALNNLTLRQRNRLKSQEQLLRSLSYQKVLERGYALIRDDAGKMVRQAQGLTEGQKLDLQFADGHVAALVETQSSSSAPGGGEKPAQASSSKSSIAKPSIRKNDKKTQKSTQPEPDEGQGSLF